MQQFFTSALLVLCVCASVVFAHEPLTDGPTKPPLYSSWKKALTIPSNKVTLSARRLSACAAPYFWLKYTGKKGDVIGVEAGTSGAAGLNSLRVSAAIFGPGLPARKKQFSFATPSGGARVVEGAKDVSNCKFMPADKLDGEVVNTIKGVKRCGTISPGVLASYFPLLAYKFTLPATGTFYIAYFTQGQYDGRYYIATGSWGHVHDNNVVLPTPPKGNAGTPDSFWAANAKATCCVKKGKNGCPARKIYK